MPENLLSLNDKLNADDSLSFAVEQSKGFKTDIRGFNELGEELFRTENSIVLGGALFVLEKVFGVSSPLTVDYLNNIMGIATNGTPVTDIYPKDTKVCLFGVGTGGSGDSITSVKPVKFQEREVLDMIPFRATANALASTDVPKYWFKKDLGNGRKGYYLKKFEANPQIKVLWKDAVGDEDGTTVEAGVHNSTRTEAIETFVELVLKINKNDCREWFEINGNVEQTRINSIGLFTGIESTLADGSKDYKQVKLFSKLNINNEMLTLAKDLTIVYRIYTS
jgi:hypothetical protein